ncbi:MAG: DUF1015 domain-containing protein [Clostridia bacterium]|nr:DUF1015 domain-containing protein [Clostridia bacterium]
MRWNELGVSPANILLPAAQTDFGAYAALACDQFTSEPEYWQQADRMVGDKPSALRLMLPELYLNDAEARIPAIRASMRRYVDEGILQERVRNGFVLTARETTGGVRPGLLAAIDLEAYGFQGNTGDRIRATEGTIADRIPPRAAIRKGAPLDMPHILALINDPAFTVIEPLLDRAARLECLYDFDLMLGGGHLKGWAVTAPQDLAAIEAGLYHILRETGFLLAIGDGNHSLAAAGHVWDSFKQSLTPEERRSHPARFALVEMTNVHSKALRFEPIHRLVTGVAPDTLTAELTRPQQGRHGFTLVTQAGDARVSLPCPNASLPVATLQGFLDAWLADHPQAGIDYIHGEASLRMLAEKPGAAGFLLPAIDKNGFFAALQQDGVLPRKTFSMGEAREKRYYLEARALF